MFRFDVLHEQGHPPVGIVRGVLWDLTAGTYHVRVRDTQLGPITEWTEVVVDSTGEAAVSAVTSVSLGAGPRRLYVVAEWREANGTVKAMSARHIFVQTDADAHPETVPPSMSK